MEQVTRTENQAEEETSVETWPQEDSSIYHKQLLDYALAGGPRFTWTIGSWTQNYISGPCSR